MGSIYDSTHLVILGVLTACGSGRCAQFGTVSRPLNRRFRYRGKMGQPATHIDVVYLNNAFMMFLSSAGTQARLPRHHQDNAHTEIVGTRRAG